MFSAKSGVCLLLFLFPFLGTLDAQSWNKAVFRNDEIEPRDFDFNEEYFLNILSYRITPSWKSLWNEYDKGFLSTIGSLRSDEFYMQQEVKLHFEGTERLWFHYDLLQDEDYDTRYLRHRAAIAYHAGEKWTVYGIGEGTPTKEDNDIGAGAIFRPMPGDEWEVQITAVDFAEDKGKNNRHYGVDAYGLLFKNETALSDDVFIGGAVQLQLPMTMNDPGDSLEFHFRKKLYDAHLTWFLSDEQNLTFYTGAEETKKDAIYFPAVDPDQRLGRNSWQAGVEYLGPWDLFHADGMAGVKYFHFRERSLFPEFVGPDEKHQRDEVTIYGGLAWTVSERVVFRPAVYLAYVSQNELFPEDPRRSERFNGFAGKASGTLEIKIKETIRLAINPNFDLDDLDWGGGNVQFIAVF